jgi:hypothetical protein
VATEAMIAMADRQPTRAVGINNPDATLHRPRSDEQVEAEERAAAGRSIVRLTLGRHACAELMSCPRHGRKACGRHRRCSHPQHADDLALAVEALQAFGLAEHEPVTQLRCSTCHRRKAVSQFARSNETCKPCLSTKKAAREAGMA